jgi:hypothetical protein
MQHRTFDRLTRTLAAQPTRRGFLGGLGALVAAGFAGTALGQRRDFEAKLANADDDPEEQMVLLFEEVGRLAYEHEGTCDALAEKMRNFQARHSDQIEDMRAEEVTWSKEHRERHADTYGDRRQAVVDQVTAALDRCKTGSGNAASPVAATPAALLSSADLAARVPTGPGRTSVHTWAQDTIECAATGYNFQLEGYCAREHSDWTSPSFQWPGYCDSWNIDENCDICDENTPGDLSGPEFCAKYWPQDCVESGANVCHVDYHNTHGGVASALCEEGKFNGKIFSDTVYCYSRESSWSSRKFTWNIYCPDGRIEHNCIDCQTDAAYEGLEGAEVCAKYWPQDCLMDGTRNVCYVGYHVTCCDENCPQSTTSCTISILESLGDDYECAQCILSWCGSTSKCQEFCTREDCCAQACSSDYVPPPPGGLVKRGTPVPLGTPDASPVGTPINLPPGTPATEVPPLLPPSTPATEIPTEPPGTPSASPAS